MCFVVIADGSAVTDKQAPNLLQWSASGSGACVWLPCWHHWCVMTWVSSINFRHKCRVLISAISCWLIAVSSCSTPRHEWHVNSQIRNVVHTDTENSSHDNTARRYLRHHVPPTSPSSPRPSSSSLHTHTLTEGWGEVCQDSLVCANDPCTKSWRVAPIQETKKFPTNHSQTSWRGHPEERLCQLLQHFLLTSRRFKLKRSFLV